VGYVQIPIVLDDSVQSRNGGLQFRQTKQKPPKNRRNLLDHASERLGQTGLNFDGYGLSFLAN